MKTIIDHSDDGFCHLCGAQTFELKATGDHPLCLGCRGWLKKAFGAITPERLERMLNLIFRRAR